MATFDKLGVMSNNAMRDTRAAPVILVVSDHSRMTSGSWIGVPTFAVSSSYLEPIEALGALPVVVPPMPLSLHQSEHLARLADGLLLVGGRDIDSSLYGQAPHPENDRPVRLRDELEIALINHFLDSDLPILGLCRGMQLMNLATGGTLIQHLGDVTDLEPHRGVVGTFSRHQVSARTDAFDPYIPDDGMVATHHHQAVDQIGRGWTVGAIASDGTVEGILAPARSFAVGVQWHPEQRTGGPHDQLFIDFIDAARRHHTSQQ